jgi:hypothetical protein
VSYAFGCGREGGIDPHDTGSMGLGPRTSGQSDFRHAAGRQADQSPEGSYSTIPPPRLPGMPLPGIRDLVDARRGATGSTMRHGKTSGGEQAGPSPSCNRQHFCRQTPTLIGDRPNLQSHALMPPADRDVLDARRLYREAFRRRSGRFLPAAFYRWCMNGFRLAVATVRADIPTGVHSEYNSCCLTYCIPACRSAISREKILSS